MKKGRVSPSVLARKRLLDYIDVLPKDGATRLPPERELCEKTGVSLGTLNRALRKLAAEGQLVIIPRDGVYTSGVPKFLNIGVIVGERSSRICYMRAPAALGEAFRVFSRSASHVRLIEARSPEEVPEMLEHFKFDGALWHYPDAEQLETVAEVEKACGVPVSVFSPSLAKDIRVPSAFFSFDGEAIGRLRAEFMLKRGHRAIAAFIDAGSSGAESFAAAVKEAGGSSGGRLLFSDTKRVFENVKRILDEGEATAFVLNGGVMEMGKAFRAIQAHPRGSSVEVLPDYIGPSLHDLMAANPRVKVVGVNVFRETEVCRAAAEALMARLEKGTPMESKLFLTRIVGLEELPR